MGMTPEEKYYWELSEVYLAKYQNSLEHRNKISVAMGLIVEMQSELLKFQIKNPNKTDAISQQENRLSIFKEVIDSFTIISSRNSQTEVFLQQKHNHIMILKEEIEELKKQVDVLTKTIEHEQ